MLSFESLTPGATTTHKGQLPGGFMPLRKTISLQPRVDAGDDSSTQPEEFLPIRRRNTSFTNKETIYETAEESARAWDNSPWKFMSTRKISFHSSTTVNSDPTKGAVVVVDPFSTGAILAAKFVEAGFNCIRVLSEWNSPVASLVAEGAGVAYDATVQHDSRDSSEASYDRTVAALRRLPWRIDAVVPGCETGVLLADILASKMGARCNGMRLSRARRNKYEMGETVRAAGVRAVKQVYARSQEDVDGFLEQMETEIALSNGAMAFKAVVKPVESAGTDDVFLCTRPDEVVEKFHAIFGKVNGLGAVNDAVLLQEFLSGSEYVVDGCSRNGEYKTACVWKYDKRAVNGANFVYFGMEQVDATTDVAQQLMAYTEKVCAALEITEGPSHAEVMMTPTGPCLVEVGARCHGGEGTWMPIAEAAIGYTQVDATLAAAVDPAAWAAIPKVPCPPRVAGREVFLVAYNSGTIRRLPGVPLVKALPSFRQLEMAVHTGGFLRRTIDCFTRPGSVRLIHADPQTVERDTATIRRLEKRGMFDLGVICPEPPPVGAVVVVDPFTTGVVVAAKVVSRGFHLVMLFSDPNNPLNAFLHGDNRDLKAKASITFEAGAESEAALKATLSQLRALPWPVIAVVPGAETGVPLCDKVSTLLGTRNNGMQYSEARRNKYRMGELVRAAGVRAVKQGVATSWAEAEAFVNGELGGDAAVGGLCCVVKPLESAGSDDVFKCRSVEEVRRAFDKINGHRNQLGGTNAGALLQEFLSGPEFVVDGVSRDGEHKTTAVWRYDKRSVNGANFVYHGMDLVDGRSPEARQLIAYCHSVLDALSIENGPSHAEIILTPTGPCLVEVGARCHGGEASWAVVADECIGYNQVDLCLDAYLHPDRFDAIPASPRLLRPGCEVFLVSQKEGHLRALPALDEIRALPSFRVLQMHVQPGERLVRTVDCFCRPGSVRLVGDENNPEQLEADKMTIRTLELTTLFDVVEGALPPST